LKKRKPDFSVAQPPTEGPASSLGDVVQKAVSDAQPVAKKAKRDDTVGTSKPSSIMDDELDLFLSTLASVQAESSSAPTPEVLNPKRLYKTSQPETVTLFEAAPMLIGPENGNTIVAQATAATNPFAGRVAPEFEGPVAPLAELEEEEVEESEATRRARLEKEEREEIMDRLEEETRVQSVAATILFGCIDI
jgi:hypothetical protein